jgi:hypothetical protein
MIEYLDHLLHRLLRNRVAQLSADGQIRFQPPDEDWRAMVPNIVDGAGNPATSVNAYLVDLRENRKLRTNERLRENVGADVFETPPARRVDCHYLLSAWSPATATAAFDPTPDEHALLAEIAQALGEHDDLDPVAIYAASNPPAPPPPAIAQERFPIVIMPPEGFAKLAEFWGTMGDKHRWKPCVYAIVTVALPEGRQPAGPMVTTAIVTTGTAGAANSSETFMQIGGTVRASAATNAPPVQGAWIELRTMAGVRRQLVRTDADGRFLLVQLAAGTYQIRASAVGLGTVAITIDVPSPSGSYDLHF